MKKTVRLARFTKGEKLLFSIGIFSLLGVIFVQVFCGASIGNLNINIEQLKGDIKTEEKKIESLNMKVSELTAFENVKSVVKDLGLAYNNDNIIIISE